MPTILNPLDLDRAPAAVHRARFAGFVRIAAVAAVAPWRLFVALFRRLRNWREVMTLSEFTDEQLADIGLTRSDVRGALSGSPMDDPSLYLVEKSGHRFHRPRDT